MSLTGTRRRWALLCLALACFISVTSENLPISLNPQLSDSLSVSASAVGYLVSGYAVVVALTAIPLVRVAARLDRRTVAVLTVGTVAVANLGLALAPTYPAAAGARLIAALGHGVLWSTVAPTAARIAGPEQSGRATGTVFLGNSAAFVLGLPLSSGLGAALGWRPVVGVLALGAAVIVAGLWWSLPAMPPERDGTEPDGSGQPGRLRSNRALLWVVVATFALVLGHFTPWTYVTLLIGRYAGLHGAAVSAVLLANGAFGLVVLMLMRRGIDARLRAMALVVGLGLTICMTVLLTLGPVSDAVAVVVLVAWALPGACLALVLQAAVLRAAPRAQDLASAVYVAVFQVGIAGGAAVGGRLVGQGLLAGTLVVAAVCGVVVTAVALGTSGFDPDRARRAISRRAVRPSPS